MGDEKILKDFTSYICTSVFSNYKERKILDFEYVLDNATLTSIIANSDKKIDELIGKRLLEAYNTEANVSYYIEDYSPEKQVFGKILIEILEREEN